MGLIKDILQVIVHIRWNGKSVCGLVAIIGLICIMLGKITSDIGLMLLGAFFVVLAVIGAVLITDMISSRYRRW